MDGFGRETFNQFNHEAFNQFALDNGVVGFFQQPITLKSGRQSHWYANWRTVADDAFLLDKLTDYVLAFTKTHGLQPDCFFGVPEGATKLALLTQYKWAKQSPQYAPGSHCLPMGRGKPKFHGAPKDRYFLGEPRGKIVVLEDVTTTGGSLLTTIHRLRSLDDVKIIAAIGLTNRMELTPFIDGDSRGTVVTFKKIFEETTGHKYERPMGVPEVIRYAGIEYAAMSSATFLLPAARERLNLREDITSAVNREFQRYGVVGKIEWK
ncbi:MAG: hypothetical protein AB1668_03610 [Nanoarchaeota archaeon]